MDRHSAPPARQTGRDPVSRVHRHDRVRRGGRRPPPARPRGQEDPQTQTPRFLRFAVPVQRLPQIDGAHSAPDRLRAAALRLRHRLRVVHRKRTGHVDLLLHRADDLRQRDPEHRGRHAEKRRTVEKPSDQGIHPDLSGDLLLRRGHRRRLDPDRQVAGQPDYGAGRLHGRPDAGIQGPYPGAGRGRDDLRERHAAASATGSRCPRTASTAP